MATGTAIDVVMPQMGVSVSEGTIVKWLKNEGEPIEADEALLEIYYKNKVTIFFITHDLEEAIFLADRLLILSARPASVKQVLAVDLPRPRDFHLLTSRRYGELKQEALEALYQEAVKAFAKGSKAAYDLVEAFGKRVGDG